MQQKECSTQKIEENKSDLEFNFLWNSKCASLNFEIWVLGANLNEPYCPYFYVMCFDCKALQKIGPLKPDRTKTKVLLCPNIRIGPNLHEIIAGAKLVAGN